MGLWMAWFGMWIWSTHFPVCEPNQTSYFLILQYSRKRLNRLEWYSEPSFTNWKTEQFNLLVCIPGQVMKESQTKKNWFNSFFLFSFFFFLFSWRDFLGDIVLPKFNFRFYQYDKDTATFKWQELFLLKLGNWASLGKCIIIFFLFFLHLSSSFFLSLFYRFFFFFVFSLLCFPPFSVISFFLWFQVRFSTVSGVELFLLSLEDWISFMNCKFF